MRTRKVKAVAKKKVSVTKKAALEMACETGPRKKAPKGPPAPVFSTHKVRSRWFQQREAWPYREAPIHLLIRERARADLEVPDLAGTEQWQEAGPTNIGGRMTAVVSHPLHPERIWAGAAGGGVWASGDGGKTWTGLWHKQPSLNIGSLALDPHEPDTIYCGTGEANLSADSHPGVGMFRSLNGGQSWQLLAASESVGIPRRIGVIVVDPFDASRLFIGGVGHAITEASGLFRSTDGGTTWARVQFDGEHFYRCHDLQCHPTQMGVLYATITALGSKNGIWKSTDAGQNWTHLLSGLPSPDKIGRTSLAMAPSDPKIIYAQVESLGKVLGIFRTANDGTTWQSVGGNHFANERQMSYGNAIVVHPQDPQIVLCGGVDLHRTDDGGARWKQVTKWNARRGTANYAHADHHALLMPVSQPGWVYDMNDGGMDFSADGGQNWENRSSGLASNMYYDLDVAQSDVNFYGGGLQDNGTVVTFDGQPNTFRELTGGDGGWLVIDPKDALHLFTSSQEMAIYRFRGNDDPAWKDVSPPEDQFKMWMVFICFDPKNRKTVFTGSRRVWRTLDDADAWTAVSDNLDDSDITAIDVTRADSKRVYVGTENGGFFRSTDGGETWSGNLASTVLPGRTITRIETKPNDADVVYVTVANYGSSHVFRSSDGGTTWVDIDQGKLPDVPHNALCIPDGQPNTIYVCNDVGVFVSKNEGAAWSDLTRNLPNVMVIDLVFHDTTSTLFAATYGRGAWRLKTT
jgi:photosystem II stability/assembly factor-like uncharacterized protein